MSNRGSLPDRLPGGAASTAVALGAGVAGVLGSYGAAGFTPAFVVAPVERTLSRLMPGEIVAFAITVLGSLGQQLNLAFATGLVVVVFAAVTALALGIGRRLGEPGVPTLVTMAAIWGLAAALTVRTVPALGAAAGAGLVVAVSEAVVSLSGLPGASAVHGNDRRRVVAALGTAAVASTVGVASGRSGSGSDSTSASGSGPQSGDEVSTEDLTFDVADRIESAEAKSFDVEGMDPALSEGFFQVAISSVDPDVSTGEWTLSVTGEVKTELELTYDDLRSRDREHRFVTLRCVGEYLNGHKMDTALWTGTPVAPIIDEVSPTGDCNCVMLHGEDGYSVQFPIEAFRSGMLAYGMNGRLLPRGHGAPVRALAPGHWGETNAKWITEIEFLEEAELGYWEQRGWHGTGPVKTVAKLHGKQRGDDGRAVVGGHAYAGTRGISAVEVSTDGGDTWERADLAERLGGTTGPAAAVGGGGDEYATDAWRSWRYDYDSPDGPHEVTVRAIEADGTVQSSDETGPYPSGASGWVTETIEPGRL